MDLQKHVKEVDELGYTTVKNVIGPDEIQRLKQALDVTMEEDWRRYGGLPGKKKRIVLDLTNYCSVYTKLLENEKMHQVFSALLGETCILYSYTSTLLRPQEVWDVDPIHVDTHRLVPGYATGIIMSIALDDFTEENGATMFLPGSHEMEGRPTDEEFYKNAVTLERKAGDAAVFNARILHAPGLNKTDQTRYAVGVYACRSFMRQRYDFVRMIPEEQLMQMPERVRAFLGYNVRVPTCQEEFFVPEEKRLYKANQG